MQFAICDDNPHFARELEQYIRQICAQEDKQCQCTLFDHPSDLLASNLEQLQVLFLDIDMPDLNGLDTARRVRERSPDLLIVFVTAWLQYAPYGYEVSAFRYLLKNRLDVELAPCLRDLFRLLAVEEEMLSLTTKSGTENLPLDRICYLSGTGYRTVVIHTVRWERDEISYNGTLNELEQRLSAYGFLRIQRSFLVNPQYIMHFKNYEVTLKDETVLPVSRKQFSELRSAYLIWKGESL